jgi:signal transduction histidine kinase
MDQKQTELIRRIASVMGHELRNPLAVINNSAYFLKTKLGNDGRLDPKVEKHLGIVTSEIARADRMIADILVYSRPIEPRQAPLELSALAEAAVAALAAPDSIKTVKKWPKGGVQASGDEKLIGDALRRLLDNAVEAMAGGGTITISAGREGELAFLRVDDTGAGIKPEVLPGLFEPFRTGKPRGMGLSLALSRRIVEAHGGRIEGGNAPKGGATFRLLIPAAA